MSTALFETLTIYKFLYTAYYPILFPIILLGKDFVVAKNPEGN